MHEAKTSFNYKQTTGCVESVFTNVNWHTDDFHVIEFINSIYVFDAMKKSCLYLNWVFTYGAATSYEFSIRRHR